MISRYAWLLLMLISAVGSALEIEDEQKFHVNHARYELRILSNTDLDYFAPLINAFQERNPTVNVHYIVASSAELFKAINEEELPFDVVISSAMDLQMKLTNDGLGQIYRSAATDSLPDWARWQNRLFAFTQEPAVLIASKKGLTGLQAPSNRQELISLLRDNPEHFKGKVGTYDIRESGAGYLFGTQDSRQSDAFWRLAEVMGALSPRLYCCSSGMISDLESGKILLAYNVVGSYASAVLDKNGDGIILPLTDYTHFMLRTALIPQNAESPQIGGLFVDFLVGIQGRRLLEGSAGLPPIDGAKLAQSQHYRPIRLGPGLLVYLDKIKRHKFLEEWTDAMVRP